MRHIFKNKTRNKSNKSNRKIKSIKNLHKTSSLINMIHKNSIEVNKYPKTRPILNKQILKDQKYKKLLTLMKKPLMKRYNKGILMSLFIIKNKKRKLVLIIIRDKTNLLYKIKTNIKKIIIKISKNK